MYCWSEKRSRSSWRGWTSKVTLHKLIDAKDKDAFIKSIADKIGAIAVTYTNEPDQPRLHAALPQARAGVELRRRLRPRRRQMGGRARHRRHQHARGAERRSGRHRARAIAVHGARIPAGRALCACRQMAAGAVPAHQGDATQPHRRHGRHGPYRQGHRAPARCLRRAGGLSLAQPASRRELQVLSQARRHGARRRHVDGDRAGRAGDAEHDQRRSAQGAGPATASSSTWRAARWWTSRR